jgi:hypothetical protein
VVVVRRQKAHHAGNAMRLTAIVAAATTACVLALAASSARAEPFGSQGQIALGSDFQLAAASSVPRAEPYYAFRDERRTLVAVRPALAYFVARGWSVGAAATIEFDHSAALGTTGRFGAAVDVGHVGDTRQAPYFWPSIGVATKLDVVAGGHSASSSLFGQARWLAPFGPSMLVSIGARLDVEVVGAGAQHEVTATAVGALYGFLDRGAFDAVPAAPFARRGTYVLAGDAGFSIGARTDKGTSDYASAGEFLAVAFDGFVADSTSLGVLAGVRTLGNGVGALTTMVAGGRVGRLLPVTRRVDWWPRAGFELSRAQASVSGGASSAFDVFVDAPFVFRLPASFAFALGPAVRLPVARSNARDGARLGIDVTSSLMFVL